MKPAESDPIEIHPTRAIRTLDLAVVVLSAPIWVPALIAISGAVLLSSGRPIHFTQERVGRGGTTFSMLKFRSMLRGDNPLVPDPNRITPVGRALRRMSLDELPQLLNVLRGDMSLVGPRPMLPEQFAELSEHERTRSAVRPGLTGLAQVNGRNSLRWAERFSYDLTWATQPSVSQWARTLAKTIRVVIRGNGIAGHDATDPLVDLSPTIIRIVDFDLSSDNADQRAA